MRSVVVVLPASMCAMIPMLRVFSRLNLRGMSGKGWKAGGVAQVQGYRGRGHKKRAPRARMRHDRCYVTRSGLLCGRGHHPAYNCPVNARVDDSEPTLDYSTWTALSLGLLAFGIAGAVMLI